MPRRKADSVTETFERALRSPGPSRYTLRLYVAGATSRSTNAIRNIKRICEDRLLGHYDLQVIDIYRHPTLAAGEQIIAVPTLVKQLPSPLRRLVGDLSDKEQVLLGLDLRTAEDKP